MKKPMFIVMLIVVLLVSAGATYFILTTLREKEEPAASETANPEVTVDSSMRPDAAQQDQNDTTAVQRQDVEVKNRLSATVSAIYSYQTNNRGSLPTTEDRLTTFVDAYLGDKKDELHPVTKVAYVLTLTPTATSDIQYQSGFTCSEDGTSAIAGTPRQFALTTTLPSGATYCIGQ